MARKQSIDKLSQSKDLLLSIIDNTTAVIYAKDLSGRYILINKRYEDLFTISREEITGKKDIDIFPDKTAKAFFENDQKVILHKKPIEFEETVPHDDGLHTYISLKFPIYDEKEEIYAVCGISTDITERKAIEEELRKKTARLSESEEKYRQLFSTESDAIILIDAKSRQIVDVNDAALHLYGYSKEEFLELSHNDITAEPEKSNISVDKTLKGEMKRIPHRYHRKKDGTIFSTEISVGYFKWKDRHIICGIIRDTTELRQTLEALGRRESELMEKSSSLEEINTALKVLLSKRDDDKKEVQENIVSNVRNLILPCIEKLKKSGPTNEQMTTIEIMESYINEIASPFYKELSSKYIGLTPTEIKIANLIREGKTTKEISEMLFLSTNTIIFHRHNIRKKLKIKNKKINLRAYLTTIY